MMVMLLRKLNMVWIWVVAVLATADSAIASSEDWIALEIEADDAEALHNWPAAEAALAAARKSYLTVHPFDPAIYAELIYRHADMILMQEDAGRAMFMMQDALEDLATRAGETHPELVGLHQRLGDIRGMRGQWLQGHRRYIRATYVADHAFGPNSFEFLEARLRYLNWLRAHRRAERFKLRRSFQSMIGEPEDYTDLAKSLTVRLAWAKLAQTQQQLDRAQHLLEEGWKLAKGAMDLGPAIRWNYAAALARHYRQTNQIEKLDSLVRAAAVAPDDPFSYAPLLRAEVEYHEDAEAEGIEPWIVADVRIDRDGFVTEVTIVDSTGNALFEASVASAMRQWRFAPAIVGDSYRPRHVRGQRYRVSF